MFKVLRKLNFQKHTHRFFSNFAKVNCLKYSISQSIKGYNSFNFELFDSKIQC